MRVVLHARNDVPQCAALAAGCRAIGHTVVWQRPALWSPRDVDPAADVAVVFGVAGPARTILDTYRARGVECWILDFPRLRAFPHEVGCFKNDYAWLPESRAKTDLAPLESVTPTVTLVIGQKPGDGAHGMDAAAMHRWLRETVAACRAESDRPIVVRPHPKDTTKRPADGWGADAVHEPSATPLDAALAEAAVVVTYNSTVGWDAIVAGVPVAARSLEPVAYAPYVTESTATPAILSKKLRTEAIARARASQWTLDALRDGTAVRAMQEAA